MHVCGHLSICLLDIMYLYICVYVCMYVFMYGCLYVYMYVCMYVCMYVYMYVCTKSMHTFACIRIKDFIFLSQRLDTIKELRMHRVTGCLKALVSIMLFSPFLPYQNNMATALSQHKVSMLQAQEEMYRAITLLESRMPSKEE